MNDSSITRLLLLLTPVLLAGCDLAEPLLTDQDSLDAETSQESINELAVSTCEAAVACCGAEAAACSTNLANGIDALIIDVDLATSYAGLLVARDMTCPLLPFAAEVTSTCAPGSLCESPCKPYTGAVAVGGNCQSFSGVDDCAQGLLCFTTAGAAGGMNLPEGVEVGVCSDPCARVGQACNDQAGQWPTAGRYLQAGSSPCGPAGYCEAPAPSQDGICQAVQLEGQACPLGIECAPKLYCDPQASVCTPRLTDGQACSGSGAEQCVDGFICNLGSCQREWSAPDPAAMVGCGWLFNQ